MKRVVCLLSAGCVTLALGFAQEKKVVAEKVEDVIILNRTASGAGAGQAGNVMAATFFFGEASKKGAPYAAETSNESVQVLADGNRIVHKSTSKVYRDAEGRTRLESAFVPVGNWVPENGAGSIITIHDPVSGEHVTLNTASKTAFKTKAPAARVAGAKEGRVEVRSMARVQAAPSGGGPMWVQGSGMPGMPGMALRLPRVQGAESKSEQLGKQTIEGVLCEGTRETMTLPAGAMGNERPIVVTTERWVSPELGIEIMRKHSDPRSGESTYRVSVVQRGEQPKSLFEVPADYKVEEGPKGLVFERKIESKDNI